jgi:hypothetical protein
MYTLHLFDAPGGSLLLHATNRLLECEAAWDDGGPAELTASVRLGLAEQLRIAGQRTGHVVLCHHSAPIWAGRAEELGLSSQGLLTIGAYGYQRACADTRYTALWSDDSVAGWRPIRDSERGDTQPDRWSFDTNNRLYMAPQKNSSQGTTTCAYMLYQSPDGGARNIIGIDFAFEMSFPSASWRLQLLPLTTAFSAGAAIFTLNGSGVLQTGARHLTFAATPWLAFQVQFNAAAAIFPNESGTAYARITSLRLVTTTANRVNTTLTAARTAGASVTATVGSTARMYVGQRLVVRDSGSTIGEIVTVESIPSSTTFVATFGANYSINATVQAQMAYPDEIVRDLVTSVNAINPTQLSAATVGVQSLPIDLTNASYEDATPQTIGRGLAELSAYRFGVDLAQALVFEPNTANAQTWAVDAARLRVDTKLDQVANRIYTTYQEAGGRTLRTAAASNMLSSQRYGVVRMATAQTQSANSAIAEAIRAAALSDQASPPPRAEIVFDRLYTASGGRANLHQVRPGDTILIRNLPPAAEALPGEVQSFRVARCQLRLRAGETAVLEVEPDTPTPYLEVLLARLAL